MIVTNCFLFQYCLFLGVIFAGQLIIGILAFAYKDWVSYICLLCQNVTRNTSFGNSRNSQSTQSATRRQRIIFSINDAYHLPNGSERSHKLHKIAECLVYWQHARILGIEIIYWQVVFTVFLPAFSLFWVHFQNKISLFSKILLKNIQFRGCVFLPVIENEAYSYWEWNI